MHLVNQLDQWSVWAVPNPKACPCGGSGWLRSDFDTVHRCGLHGGTPHPEDDEGYEHFNYEAHRLKCLREAFVTYREAAGMSGPEFKAAVLKQAGPDASPQDMVDVAQQLAEDALYDAHEAEARARGFSCGLEMRLAEEARIEASEKGCPWAA